MPKYRLTSGEYFEGKIEEIYVYNINNIIFQEAFKSMPRDVLAKITAVIREDLHYLLVIQTSPEEEPGEFRIHFDTANHPFTERAYEDSRIIYEKV